MLNAFCIFRQCGVFLIPFFLNGDGLEAVPLSAVVGSVVGSIMGIGIYYANKSFTEKISLTVFVALILLFLAAGLFTGGCHNLEMELGTTKEVWHIQGEFWDVHRLPMTVLKPFGYNDSRTVLEITMYWGWLALGAVLHYRKYKQVPVLVNGKVNTGDESRTPTPQDSKIDDDDEEVGKKDSEVFGKGDATVDVTTLADSPEDSGYSRST